METAFRLIRILTLFTILCANGAFGASEEPMMKAVVAHEYGAPEVLKFEEVSRPEPKDDEALVR
jgi:NADPH:quinone reductase and related Zn-dependent oxidoreductases